jgi:hypothetical protein
VRNAASVMLAEHESVIWCPHGDSRRSGGRACGAAGRQRLQLQVPRARERRCCCRAHVSRRALRPPRARLGSRPRGAVRVRCCACAPSSRPPSSPITLTPRRRRTISARPALPRSSHTLRPARLSHAAHARTAARAPPATLRLASARRYPPPARDARRRAPSVAAAACCTLHARSSLPCARACVSQHPVASLARLLRCTPPSKRPASASAACA